MAESEAPSSHPTRHRVPTKPFEQEPIVTHKKRASTRKAPTTVNESKETDAHMPQGPRKRGPYKKRKAVEAAGESKDSTPNGQLDEQPTSSIGPAILVKSEPTGPLITAPTSAENAVIIEDPGVTSIASQPSASTAYPWTPEREEAFLLALVEARGLGLQNGNGWKTKAFKMCVTRLNDLFLQLSNMPITAAILHSKWANMKTCWKDYLKHEAHISGWGPNRDPLYGDIGIPVSDDETMKGHYKQFGACRKFKTHFPAHKELLEQIIGDRLADGRDARGLKSGKVPKVVERSEKLDALMEGKETPERCVIARKRDREVEESPEAIAKKSKVDSRVEAMNNSAQKIEKLSEVMAKPRVTPLAFAMRKVNDIFFEDSITCRELWFYLMRDPVKVDFFNGLTEDKDVAWFINDCLGRDVLTENCKVEQLKAEIMAMEGSDDEDVVFNSDDEAGQEADEIEEVEGGDK